MINYFLKHEIIHLIITFFIAFAFYLKFKDKRLLFFSFLFGVFIDIDHFFDFFYHFGFSTDIYKFFQVDSYILESEKVFVPLHGWEFILIFFFLGLIFEKKFKINGLALTISVSYFGHLLWDNISFAHHYLCYFLTYRFLNNFTLKSFNNF